MTPSIEDFVIPTFKPEEVKCLGQCGKTFVSWNKKYNRICPECKQRNQYEEEQPTEEPYWDNLEDLEIDLDPAYWDFCNDLS
jgi:hypothetical protein